MQRTVDHPRMAGPAVVGLLLIVLGAVALAGRQLGIDFFELVGDQGWPLFILVPGLVLLALAIVPAPPRGIGFAIAGAVVTSVGGLLLYQARSDDWQSWAYAWAVIPLAVGLAMVLYGLYARVAGLVTAGLWTGGIAAIVLTVGAWYFQGIFAGKERPTDLASSWPIVVIGIGVLIVIRALFGPASAGRAPGPSLEAPMSGAPAGGASVRGEPVSGEPVSGEPVSGEPQPLERASGQPRPLDSASDEPKPL